MKAGDRHFSREFIDRSTHFPYIAPYIAGEPATASSPSGRRTLFSMEQFLLFFILHPIV